MTSSLFSGFRLRDLALKNRIVISPMCMYSAPDARATDFHLAHYSGLAAGGAGLVMIEATSVLPEGRLSHGDLGLWEDAQIAPLARVIAAMKAAGAAVGVQLVHGGRKAARQRPWFGNGALGPEDAARGDLPWPLKAASALAFGAGYLTPSELGLAEIAELRAAFAAAARRAVLAGADLVEIHAAHGFLLHGFMSPLTNQRRDDYNGDFAARHRLAYEVAADIRAAIPAGMPLALRLSLHDGADGGRAFAETLQFAAGLAEHGVDLVDCSSGGIGGHSASTSGAASGFGFQLPDTARVRAGGGLPTMAVGLITEPALAERAVTGGQTDLVGIGREALWNPHWPRHAQAALEGPDYADFPVQYGWWLQRRQSLLDRIKAQEG